MKTKKENTLIWEFIGVAFMVAIFFMITIGTQGQLIGGLL